MSNHTPGHIRDNRNYAISEELRVAVRQRIAADGGAEYLAEAAGLRPVQVAQLARGQHSKVDESDIHAVFSALRM